MVLTFNKTIYMCAIPLIKLQNPKKRKIYTIVHLTVFSLAFCHRRVKNLLKGLGTRCEIRLKVLIKTPERLR